MKLTVKAQSLDSVDFKSKSPTSSESSLDSVDFKVKQPLKKIDPQTQGDQAKVMKMQNDIQNIGNKVSSSNNNVLYSVLSGQTGIAFDLKKAMNELSVQKFKVDGVWGLKTQEALNSIYKLAGALINANANFALNVPGYNAEYFTNFRQLISGYKFDKNKKIDLPLSGEFNQAWRADLISTHINTIITFYDDIVNALNNKNLTTNKTVFKKEKSNALEGHDKELVNQYLQNYGEHDVALNLNLDGKQTKITIPLMALQSVKDFKDWFSTSKYKDMVAPYETAETFFNQVVKPQLG